MEPPRPSNSTGMSAHITETDSGTSNASTMTSTPKRWALTKNGSFECDRIVKDGTVRRQTSKTKTWKKIYLVLRPKQLSIYQNEQEFKLRDKIKLSELTTVAYLHGRKRAHVFGLFTLARNYYMQASSEPDALAWVGLIRKEARLEEAEERISLASTATCTGPCRGLTRSICPRETPATTTTTRTSHARFGSSSPEPMEPWLSGTRRAMPTTTRDGIRIPPVDPAFSSTTDDLHGASGGAATTGMSSYSELSDTLASSSGWPDSTLSLALSHTHDSSEEVWFGGHCFPGPASASASAPAQASNPPHENHQPLRPTTASSQTATGAGTELMDDPERVIRQGYLHCLKSKSGVRSWKRLWAVLRAKNLAFYKDEQEYKATLLLPVSSILDAVEIAALSKTKQDCMQIITPAKSYRFCAADEHGLAPWLGALKSLVVRKKRARILVVGGGGGGGGSSNSNGGGGAGVGVGAGQGDGHVSGGGGGGGGDRERRRDAVASSGASADERREEISSRS